MNDHIIIVIDTEGQRNLVNLYEVASITESKEMVNTITMSSGKNIETKTIGFDDLKNQIASLKERS